MKDVEMFGNLLNQVLKPYSLKYVRDNAQLQGQKGMYQLAIIDDEYIVVKCLGGTITDYCIIDTRDNYKELYTNSKDSQAVRRQALYHGTCLLEGYGLGYDL